MSKLDCDLEVDLGDVPHFSVVSLALREGMSVLDEARLVIATNRDIDFEKVLRGDATDALALATAATAVAGGEYDLVVSCVSTARAEMAAILCCRTGGTVYFFSMATSFTAAALGAEGVSRDIDMLIGNGFAIGHAEETLALLRESDGLCRLFTARYG